MISFVYFNFVVINTITKRVYCFKYFKIIYLLARFIKQFKTNKLIFTSFSFMQFILISSLSQSFGKFLQLILFDLLISNLLKLQLDFFFNFQLFLFVFQNLFLKGNKQILLVLLFVFDYKVIFHHLQDIHSFLDCLMTRQMFLADI